MAGTRLLVQTIFVIEIFLWGIVAFYYAWDDLKLEYSHPFVCNHSWKDTKGLPRKKLSALLTLWTISPKNKLYEHEKGINEAGNNVDELATIFHGVIKHYYGNELKITTNTKLAPNSLVSRNLGTNFKDHAEIFLSHHFDMNSDFDMNLVILVTPGGESLSMIWGGSEYALTWNSIGFIPHREGNIEETASTLLNQIKVIQQTIQFQSMLSTSTAICEDSTFNKYLLVDYFVAMLTPLLAPLVMPSIIGLKRELLLYKSKSKK